MAMSQTAALPLLQRAAAGTLFGAQVVVAAAVVPMSRRLPPGQYVTVHTLFTRHADAFLPLLGGTTTLLTYLRYRREGRIADLAAATALVAAGAAGAHNLAINARVASLDPELVELGQDVTWLGRARSRWARMHGVRLAGGAVALAAALVDGGARVGFGRPLHPRRPALLDLPALAVTAVVAADAVKHVRVLRAGIHPSGVINAPTTGFSSPRAEDHHDEKGALR